MSSLDWFSLFGAQSGDTTFSQRMVVDETSASFMTPQPVGLTNIQSKVIATYFTRNPIYCHPRIKIGDFANFPAVGADAKSKDSTPAVSMAATGLDFDGAMEARLIVASMDDNFDAILDDRSKCKENLEVLMALTDPESNHQSLLTTYPGYIEAAELVGAQFGNREERAVSVALTGKPSCFNGVRDGVVDVLNTSSPLKQAIGEDKIAPLLDAVQRGIVLNEELTQCKWLAIATALKRSILVRMTFASDDDELTGETHAFFPVGVEPTSRQPLVMIDGLPVLLPAPELLPEDIQASSITMEAALETNVFPKGAVPSDFLALSEDGSFVVRDASTEAPPIERHPAVAMFEKDPASLYVLPPDAEADLRSPTAHEPAGPPGPQLSFAWFPPCGFTIGRTEEEAQTLLKAPGYGRDQSGAAEYLENVLTAFENVALVDVDADGHCLLHSISRALIGKEYLWHALRTNLFRYMRDNKKALRDLFDATEFCVVGDDKEMDALVARAHPRFGCEDSDLARARGLGCEHIFALANILRRPILLIDSPDAPHQESYVFLPLLVDPKDLVSTTFIAIAWSHSVHSHYVPLVQRVKGQPATFPATSLPRDREGNLLVYATTTKQDPQELLDRYLGKQDCDAAKATYRIGGDVEFDVSPWCGGLVQALEKDMRCSVWALHEFSRYLVHSHSVPQKAIGELGCVRDVDAFLETAIKTLQTEKLGMCSKCTRTRPLGKKCCASDPRPFDLTRGIYLLKTRDRTPVESDNRCNCCMFKHWVDGTAIGPGRQIYARDLCSSLRPATVLAMSSKGLLDLKFRDGSIRYATPMIDVAPGVMVDFAPRDILLRINGTRYPTFIHVDADPLLCSVPEIVVEDNSRGMTVSDDDRAALVTGTKRLIEGLHDTVKRRKSEHFSLDDAPLNNFEPIYTDSDGNNIQWQWHDGVEYTDYLPKEVNGQIEAAFINGEESTVIEISYLRKRLTIDFANMYQANNLNLTRRIRRMAMNKWDCPNCTCENPPTAANCGICIMQNISTPRPATAFVELDSYEKKVKERKDARKQAQKAEDEKLAKELLEEDIRLEEETETDADLRPGGSLYKAAFSLYKLDERDFALFPSKAVRFGIKYGNDAKFIFDKAKNRFRYVPWDVPPAHPFHALIRREGLRTTTGLYQVPAVRWQALTFTLDPDTNVYMRMSTMYA